MRSEWTMPLFELRESGISAVPATSFAMEGIRERTDLQRLLRDCPEMLDPNLLIISEEFGDWVDSKRRIDLLAIDRQGQVVVVELKRADEESLMDLQAIRYAAMVANMTLRQLVSAFEAYLAKRERSDDALFTIANHLGVQDVNAVEIVSSNPRIILVSATFSSELTTSVLWLNEQGLDIVCVRVVPYRVSGHVLVDVSQIIPLPEATQYIVRLREKDERTVPTSFGRRERTQTILDRLGLWRADVPLVFDRRRLPSDYAYDEDDPRFLAHVGPEPGVRRNVIWRSDGEAYSLSALTEMMRDDLEVPLARGALNGYYHWCLADHPDTSLWELAEAELADLNPEQRELRAAEQAAVPGPLWSSERTKDTPRPGPQ